MPRIKTCTAACRFLEGEGFKASTSTFDRHFKAGKVGKNKKGEFEEKVLLEYARVHLKKAETGKSQEQEDLDLARARKEEELGKIREQRKFARLKRLKLEKKVVPSELYEKDLAARMAFFSTQLDALFPRLADECVRIFLGDDQGRADQLIELVGGKPDKVMELVGFVEKLTPEIIAVLMSQKARWLEAFAKDRVHVVALEEYIQEGESDVSA